MIRDLFKPLATQRDLAQQSGYSEGYVSQIVNGKRHAPARFKLLCVKKFGLPVHVLFPEGEQDERD